MNYLIFFIVILFSLNASSENFDEKIKKFILNNPEIILQSLENYEKKQISEKKKLNSQIIANNRKQIFNTSNGMYSGNLDSKNVIIEFFDYNCSYCKKAHQDILKIEQNKKNIKVIYKNFPILSESSKKLAEIALLIAKDNNEKFIKFHNLIMSRKGLINKSQLKDILDDLGYDESKLKDNLNSEYIKNQLLKDRQLAEKLSLRGTPAFIVNDKLFFGYIDYDELVSHIKN
ncbi:DsbA family protein [Alphaproteobacteria bacterium]|nr:DsbA family protein [Alphaproteobacteria bacterium]